MEEEFKKREEDDGGNDDIAMKGEDQGMEGVGEVLEVILENGIGVLKEGIAENVVLDDGCEDVLMDGNPSWVTINGEKEKKLAVSLEVEGLEEDACDEGVVASVIAGAEEEVHGSGGRLSGAETVAVGKSGGSAKSVGILNWKKAVVGGGESIKMGISGGLSGDKGVCDDGADKGADHGRRGVNGGDGGKVKGKGGGPGKVCREINFDEKGGGFLDDDGETVHMDRSEVLECEKSLERAIVGKILGRQVPFGFLHRELRKKWGKFGRAHLSLVGSNCFVCFFSSKEIRDAVLRGGPWFVGNQLVGVARWSSDFEPSSLKGFSTPIWVRFPLLPLNLWSDQNLGRIALSIGKPLWVDEVTSSWGRTEFARVCVRIDFAKKLPKGVWIHDGVKRFFQPVVYEGIDQICFQCGMVGHLNGDCLKNVSGGEDIGGEAVMVEPQMRSVGDGVETVKGNHQESNQGATDMGASSKVVGADFVQVFRAGVKEKKVEEAGIFGFQKVDLAKEGGGSIKGVGREEEEGGGGGGWTLVGKKKSKPTKPKPVGQERGVSGPRKVPRGDASGRKKGGSLAFDPPLVTPMIVYKRTSVSASGSGVFSASKCLRPLDAKMGKPGMKPGSLKRPKGKERVGAMSSCGEVDSLAIYAPTSPRSPVEEGLMKRRRGGEDSHSGGDASPLVNP